MVQEDWIDFVCRLTSKFDKRYVPGALADPGDLLEYVLSIVPEIAQMSTVGSSWTTTPGPCYPSLWVLYGEERNTDGGVWVNNNIV